MFCKLERATSIRFKSKKCFGSSTCPRIRRSASRAVALLRKKVWILRYKLKQEFFAENLLFFLYKKNGECPEKKQSYAPAHIKYPPIPKFNELICKAYMQGNIFHLLFLATILQSNHFRILLFPLCCCARISNHKFKHQKKRVDKINPTKKVKNAFVSV